MQASVNPGWGPVTSYRDDNEASDYVKEFLIQMNNLYEILKEFLI
jgi:hypothetical protein